ncbi:MAG: XdhC family protein [Polaribacter sp.]|jgi:xanthine/CO dehydrogenase XdhC/CoxF family maturation factor|nr:XdhC family protein [Polaribacter sp.]
MIHELKKIILQAHINQKKGLKNLLVTVVDLEGSSYRKPGVRMLISEDNKMTGAVSGGCVEKEILHRSNSVFQKKEAKIITYDGRYKLGCEGVLYILIEPFFISEEFYNRFVDSIFNRESIKVTSFFSKNEETNSTFGSILTFQNSTKFSFSKNFQKTKRPNLLSFTQRLQPAFNLLIIGAEHDAVKLCKMASLLGWQVDLITSLKDPKSMVDFPGANSVIASDAEIIDFSEVNENTGVVIMNHSYVQDLKYLLKLVDKKPAYLGVLGAAKRRDKMFTELFEYNSSISEDFLERIYTPAGLNLGAQTPEEIAISILAEILATVKNKKPDSLKNIIGHIHQN